MNEIIKPRFEAYVSIDVSSQLTDAIYEIRERLGDRKMTVMPVDAPLFGHFNDTMILMRHFTEVDTLIKATLNGLKGRFSEPMEMELKLGSLRSTHDKQLVLDIQKNKWLDLFMETLARNANDLGLSFISDLKGVQDYTHGRGVSDNSLPIFVSSGPINEMEANIPDLQMIKDIEREIRTIHAFEIKSLTFYQKEAVPLTRLKSWDVNEYI